MKKVSNWPVHADLPQCVLVGYLWEAGIAVLTVEVSGLKSKLDQARAAQEALSTDATRGMLATRDGADSRVKEAREEAETRYSVAGSARIDRQWLVSVRL